MFHGLQTRPTGTEKYISRMVASGREADFTMHDPWRRRLRAEVAADFIKSLCVGATPVSAKSASDEECKPECAVRVKGATIRGALDLSGLTIVRSLIFTDCVFTDSINFASASTEHQIRLVGGRLVSVTADSLNSTSDVVVSRLTEIAEGASFVEARIGGNLRLTGSTLRTSKECPALNCTNIAVGGDLYLDHTMTYGSIFLKWAHMRSLEATNAKIYPAAQTALDAEGLHVYDDVLLKDGFEAHGEVRLLNSNVGDEIRLTRAKLHGNGSRALHAERITVRSIFLDSGFEAEGEVRLVGANVASQLNCTGGSFDRKGGGTYALDADLLTCSGDVFLNEGFKATGEVRLAGAEIKRGLTCTDGEFRNEGHTALYADGLTTEGSVYLDRGFTAVGSVRLARATVGRQLDCEAGSFRNPGGPSLDISGIVCSGDVLLRRSTSVGTVKLEGSRIVRDLDCTNVELVGCGGDVFDAKEMRVGNVFTWMLEVMPSGRVDLRFAQVRILKDESKAWDFRGELDLQGFQYEILDSGMHFEDRKTWLEKSRNYSAQPYQQLTWVYQISGKEDNVEKTVAANHAARRKSFKDNRMRRLARGWDWFIGWSVGYGYKFRRPLLAVLMLGILNVGLFYWADYSDIFHPTSSVTSSAETPKETQEDKEIDSDHCTPNYPCFIPPVYAFEILIPVLNLRQVNYWLPTPTTIPGAFLFAWVIFNIVIGWLASIAIVGGLNYAFGSDRASGTRPPPFSV